MNPHTGLASSSLLSAGLGLLVGCASPSSSDPQGSHDRRIAGFQQIESRVSETEWENTFFRIARDIHLLPKLHREVRTTKPELLASRDGTEFLFRAPIQFIGKDRLERRAFLQSTIRNLFGSSPKPDFQQTRNRNGFDQIHSEGVLGDSDPITKVSIYALNGDSNTSFLIGGVRVVSGTAPFALEQHLQELLLPLLH